MSFIESLYNRNGPHKPFDIEFFNIDDQWYESIAASPELVNEAKIGYVAYINELHETLCPRSVTETNYDRLQLLIQLRTCGHVRGKKESNKWIFWPASVEMDLTEDSSGSIVYEDDL